MAADGDVLPTLPGILGEIELIVGHSAATRLALHAGGTELKFSARANSVLSRIVGAEAAKKIVEAMGSEKYTIPMAHLRGEKGRRRMAAELLTKGGTNNQVAKAVDVHERTVRRVRKSIQQGKAGDLFDRD